jgi:HEPN domain-containing protein
LPSPECLDLARLYLRKAGEDLDAARILIDSARAADAVVGFHAQQAVEKAAKAVLAGQGIEVPKTHDLRFLFDRAAAGGLQVPDDVRDARWLTPWSVEFRYGDELTNPLDRSAAVEAASRVHEWASTLTPKETHG